MEFVPRTEARIIGVSGFILGFLCTLSRGNVNGLDGVSDGLLVLDLDLFFLVSFTCQISNLEQMGRLRQ